MDEQEQFLNQVFAGIQEAEVISIFFPLIGRALVIDTRHDQNTGPMIRLMPQVSSLEERVRSVEQVRPQLGKVHSVMGIPWTRSVRSLHELGITSHLTGRLRGAGISDEEAAAQINAALKELQRLEQLSFIRLIRGEGYATLWSADSSS